MSRYRQIVRLSLPIIGGMTSQNLLNLVDTAMVGRLGDAALAGVGIGSFANFMAIALITGLSSGVQAVAARRVGEGKKEKAAAPLHAAILIALFFGAPWAVLLHQLVPFVFPFLNPDPAVVEAGVPYLQARLWGAVAVGVNFSFRGFWNGISTPSLYFRTLLVMHAVNIGLNWVLIFGNLGFPAYGAEGAGIATAVSVFVGSGYYFVLGIRHARPFGFLRERMERQDVRNILRLAIPTSIQQILFAAGYTTLFWILGQIGTKETAAANVLINLMLLGILPSLAFGMGSASLVGQALGRRDTEDAYAWAWQVVRVAVLTMTAIGIPLAVFPDLALGVFIQEPDTIALARAPLRLFACTLAFDGVGLVLQQSFLGAGASRQAMLVSIVCQWAIFLPAAYVAGPMLGFGLIGVWVAQTAYRFIQALVYAILWRQRGWAHVSV